MNPSVDFAHRSKAYNLQHLNLKVQNQGHNGLQFKIKISFPRPQAYKNLSEYDIYALFTEKVRSLPLLRSFDQKEAECGLIRLNSSNTKKDDFCLILEDESHPGFHHGWLPHDPSFFFESFINFKKDILTEKKG